MTETSKNFVFENAECQCDEEKLTRFSPFRVDMTNVEKFVLKQAKTIRQSFAVRYPNCDRALDFYLSLEDSA